MNEGLLHINWEEFHFLRPHLLWLLIPVILSFIIAVSGLRETIKWQEVIASHLRPFMIKKGSENIKKWMHLALFITLSLGVIGVSGPTWQKIQEPDKILETPMVIVLDLNRRARDGRLVGAGAEALQAELDAEVTRQVELEATLEFVLSDEYVAIYAREEGGMLLPGEKRIVPLKAEATPVPAPAAQSTPDPALDARPWQVWWSLLSDAPLPSK